MTAGDLNTDDAFIERVIQEDLGLPTCQATLGRLIYEAQLAAGDSNAKDRSGELARLIPHPASPYFTLIEGTVGFGLSEAVRGAVNIAAGVSSASAPGDQDVKGVVLPPPSLRVIIQGCGAVGSSLAYYLVTRGIARVVAMSDKDGIIHDQKGLDIVKLLEIRAARKATLVRDGAAESGTPNNTPRCANNSPRCAILDWRWLGWW